MMSKKIRLRTSAAPAKAASGVRSIVRRTSRPKIKLTRAMTKAIKKIHFGEKKYFVTDSAGFQELSDAGTFWDLCLVPQGDGDATRDGDQLSIRSIELNLALKNLSSSTGTEVFTRIVVFQWYSQSSSAPSLPLVLFDRSGTMGAAYPFFPYNHDNRFLYRILYDKVLALGGVTVQNNPNMWFRKIRLRKIPHKDLQYSAATTNGSDHVYLLAITDRPSAITDVEFAFVAKLNFQDS